jgi:hypothetical protein
MHLIDLRSKIHKLDKVVCCGDFFGPKVGDPKILVHALKTVKILRFEMAKMDAAISFSFLPLSHGSCQNLDVCPSAMVIVVAEKNIISASLQGWSLPINGVLENF